MRYAKTAGIASMPSWRHAVKHLLYPCAAEPLYDFLKAKQSGFLVSDIKWNFTKFLVSSAYLNACC